VHGTFRVNPAYELVLYDRLSPTERDALAGLREDPGFYGVLRPREAGALASKAVDRNTALLLLTLNEPAQLPEYVGYDSNTRARREIAKLVAEDVLQVELGTGFVSGAAAVDFYGRTSLPGEGGRIAELSRDALRYAATLPIDDRIDLAVRIYQYNRLPLTPRWRRLLSTTEDHAKYLGIAGGDAGRVLARSWPVASSSSYWLVWRRDTGSPAVDDPTFKLYVSALPDALGGGGFASIVAALTSTRATQFKLGVGAGGCLRPDKLVAYFSDFDALAEGASRLRRSLSGMPAHGVPFTAEITRDGLLSWGIDPPQTNGLAWTRGESWRLWLARRLASALLQAGNVAEPWRFAIERLRLEGVDTESWTPDSAIFEER
jgi:hypothetical protein